MIFFTDWQLVIEAVRVWMAGGNPYAAFRHPDGHMLFVGAFAYPPATLLLGAPLALLPAWLSGLLVALLSVVGFEVVARQGGGRSALIWLPLWLPLAQGLWIGQLTLISVVGLALAERAYRRQQDGVAGLLIALAILKPQTVLLPAAWMLLTALRERRWVVLASFASLSAALWGGALLVSGPQIYGQWLLGLEGYDQFLPNRPLLFPPFGPLLGVMALLLWHRHGRGDIFGLALLVNTLVYPLSVIYVAVAIALVVIRWRPAWPWYPLALSWVIPIAFPLTARTPDTIAGLTQAIVATGLLVGLLPGLPQLNPHPPAPSP
jgi:hypothetical protein